MSSEKQLIQSISESGIAAVHPPMNSKPLLVGPTTEEHFNTIRPPRAPIACWSIGDARFEFGSSFVRPEIADDVKALAGIVTRLETKLGGRPIASVFGHADPVGQDAFNKKLSGRRAAAIYALLTQRAEIWEDLFGNKGKFASSVSSDEWGERALRIMLTDLGYTERKQKLSEAVEAYQDDHALAVDGDAGPKTRDSLFRVYMDKHGKTRKGDPFRLEAKDFVGRGQDSGGKGDYQGCSEFNPLVIFSKDDAKTLSKAEKKSERDAANLPNRRVVVYLFEPHAATDPKTWPCPRAKEGMAGCKKRFWSDFDTRLKNTESERLFQEDRDTFACRFYHRIAEHSPCEMTKMQGFAVYLLDPHRERLAGAEWRVSRGSEILARGTANDEALAIIPLPEVPQSVRLEWRRAGVDESALFTYARQLFPHAGGAEDLAQMLSNLGYDEHDEVRDNVRDLQADLGLALTGELGDVQAVLKQWHETGEAPFAEAAEGEEISDEDEEPGPGDLCCGEDEPEE